jgi:small GTP-binding protein
MQALALRRKFKVVFLGPSLVGKTSIVIRFSKGTFSPTQDTTIGSAFFSRDLQTASGLVTLNIWDTAGQERFKSLIPKYSRGAHAAIIVFDVSRPESYVSVQEIFNGSATLFEGNKVELFIVANKVDLPPEVDLWNARRYAESVHATYFETSAKLGKNISELFTEVAEKVARLPSDAPGPEAEPVPAPQRRRCC